MNIINLYENNIVKHLNWLNEILKKLRYNINIVFHSLWKGNTMEERIIWIVATKNGKMMIYYENKNVIIVKRQKY